MNPGQASQTGQRCQHKAMSQVTAALEHDSGCGIRKLQVGEGCSSCPFSLTGHATPPRVLQKMKQEWSLRTWLWGQLVSLFGWEGVLAYSPGSLSGSTAVGPGLALEVPCDPLIPGFFQCHSSAGPSRCLRTLVDIHPELRPLQPLICLL